MSEYYEEEVFDEYGEEFEEHEEYLSDEEIQEIQEEYRKKRLIESLIGPSVSTAFHVILIVLLAVLITREVQTPQAEIEVTLEKPEEVEIEELPPVKEPEKVEPKEKVLTPLLTQIAVEDVQTDDNALEDVNDDTPSTDDQMTENVVSDVVVSPSAFASASVYGGRGKAGRAAAVAQFGGTEIGQTKLMNAL